MLRGPGPSPGRGRAWRALLWMALAGSVAAVFPRPRPAAAATAFCSIRPPIEFSAKRTRNIVLQSEMVVRATAIGTTPPPAGSSRPGLSYMAFETREVLKGDAVPDTLRFVGYPDDRDSFQEEPVPYLATFRWRGGGDCTSTTYRPGAEYLLLLGDSPAGLGLSPYWQVLAPTNEQIRGPDDPWVGWVRQVLAGARRRHAVMKDEGAGAG